MFALSLHDILIFYALVLHTS